MELSQNQAHAPKQACQVTRIGRVTPAFEFRPTHAHPHKVNYQRSGYQSFNLKLVGPHISQQHIDISFVA